MQNLLYKSSSFPQTPKHHCIRMQYSVPWLLSLEGTTLQPKVWQLPPRSSSEAIHGIHIQLFHLPVFWCFVVISWQRQLKNQWNQLEFQLDVLPWAVQVSLSLSLLLIVTDMMLAAFPVFLRAGKEQELQQHLHGKLWQVAMHQETHTIVILSCTPSSGTFCRLNSQIVRHFGEVVVLCVVQNFASITCRLGSGTLLHRSLLLHQFPIIDIKAASMLQAKRARLSAYYIQDHGSTLAGCSQYFSMFPNSDSLSLWGCLEFQQCPHTGEGAEHPAWGWLRQFLWHWECMNAMQNLYIAI